MCRKKDERCLQITRQIICKWLHKIHKMSLATKGSLKTFLSFKCYCTAAYKSSISKTINSIDDNLHLSPDMHAYESGSV